MEPEVHGLARSHAFAGDCRADRCDISAVVRVLIDRSIRVCRAVPIAAALSAAAGCAGVLGIEDPRELGGDGGASVQTTLDSAMGDDLGGSGSASGTLGSAAASSSAPAGSSASNAAGHPSAASNSGSIDAEGPPVASDSGSIDAIEAASADGGARSSEVVIVQTTATFNNDSTSSTIDFAPTQAGDTLIVGVGMDCTSPVPSVSSVSDNKGNVYDSSGVRSTDPTPGCGDATELWYAKDVAAGTTSITVAFTAMTQNEQWLMEVAGLSPTAPFVTGAATGSPPPSGDTATAPSVAAAADNLVVCVYAACNSSSGLHAGSPFIDLAVENAEYTAYYIPTDAGTYGAVWDQSGGTYDVVSGVFH